MFHCELNFGILFGVKKLLVPSNDMLAIGRDKD